MNRTIASMALNFRTSAARSPMKSEWMRTGWQSPPSIILDIEAHI
ncbi:hypothetical protein NYQ35_01440 [Curtobacterium flaccumfaciens pv. flaccumfaciens]|nr:hypothetical protein [Curtobacterium flaccumfaciens]MCS6567453.1 hypothetical protein [Curtobacterium flaccumfaciens pv. flaccumfaciens]MCS6585535.1 hypothetical protein [Curtobacterium flaccumfaciens pv. flaccumfaciens]